jgi:hypothetical protein
MVVTSRIRDHGDYSVAVATKSENKSTFVKAFLIDNPEGNVKAVNEAWTAAGMEGSIGDTLIYQTRADLGLSGKSRAKPKSSAAPRSPAKTSRPALSSGKSMFCKEYLNDYPYGNVSAVNEAWRAAGYEGTISPALVNQIRAKLGLTGNLRASNKKPKPAAIFKKRGRPPKESAPMVESQPVVQPQAPEIDRNQALLGVEVEIDKLIFRVMSIGELLEVESALREVRRRVYGALSA